MYVCAYTNICTQTHITCMLLLAWKHKHTSSFTWKNPPLTPIPAHTQAQTAISVVWRLTTLWESSDLMLCWPFPMGIFSSVSVWRHRAGTITITGKKTWPLSLLLSLSVSHSGCLSPSLKGFVAFWKSHFCLCSGTHINRCVATCRRTRKQRLSKQVFHNSVSRFA